MEVLFIPNQTVYCSSPQTASALAMKLVEFVKIYSIVIHSLNEDLHLHQALSPDSHPEMGSLPNKSAHYTAQ